MARLLLVTTSLLAIAAIVTAQCSYYNTPVVNGYVRLAFVVLC